MTTTTVHLPCNLVAQLAFKAGGDVFHQIICNKPAHLLNICPSKFQTCEKHQGDFGTDGCVISWNYTLEGKQQIAKQRIQDVDLEKKQVTYYWIGGDLLELYNSFAVTMHVETKGDVDFATWTMKYELKKPDNPHPVTFLNFLIELTTEMENHILN